MRFASPPGLFDLLPEDGSEKWKSTYLWNHVESLIRTISEQFGFREMRTPILEKQELFQRSVGETSDVVSKEMYLLQDKGGRHLALRPEGTAPAMRAFLEHQLHEKSALHKLFYIGPMFRYERAQAGRYRQHHQWGVEAVGNDSPQQDAEVIDLLWSFYKRLGLKNLSLCINSLGDEKARLEFKAALSAYLKPSFSSLSAESQVRLELNPLRILDSKDERDREILKKAPSILDFLDPNARDHFEELQKLLQLLQIPYQINPFLVRGLDYYNRTVFEVVAGELGAQNSIGGGGRYDGLIRDLGGPSLPAIGFGTGIERIIQTLLQQEAALPSPPRPSLFLAALGEPAKTLTFSLLHDLREKGVSCEMDFSSKKLGKMLQYANTLGAQYVVVIGDEEIQQGKIELKEMATGHKQQLPLDTFSLSFASMNT